MQEMNLYHGYLPHFEIFGNGFPEKHIRYLEKFLYHQMTSWAKGTTANSLSPLTTVFSRERNRSRFASLHTMNG